MTRSVFAPRCKVVLEAVMDARSTPGANSKPLYFEVDPRSVDVNLNGYYEADTFNIEIDARIMPFDPDQVAYCACRVYMWDASRGSDNTTWAVDANLMVKGLADDIETDLVGEESIIKITGRDYTALLLDPEWDPKQKVPSGKPLDVTVQEIADLAAPKGTRARFTVVWESDARVPICGGLHRDTKKKGLAQKPGKSYWEVIWDLCIAHSFTVRMESTEADRSLIVISEPQTETKRSLEQSPRLVYGQTLDSLSIKRKFAREKVPQIVITGWDPNTGAKIEVKFPAKRNIDVDPLQDKAVDALGVKLTAKKDEVMYFPAPKGITDKDALLRQARMRFYHMGRGETVYTMRTRHLWVDSKDADVHRVLGFSGEENMLRLRPGRAIGIRFDPFNVPHLRTMSEESRIGFIHDMGYSLEVATFVARNLTKMDLFRQDYYHNRGNISYDENDGIEIEIEAANFASEVKEINFAETMDGIVIEEED